MLTLPRQAEVAVALGADFEPGRYNRCMQRSVSEFHRLVLGGGLVEPIGPKGYRLTIPSTPKAYADAQLDDTSGLARGEFVWRPPVRLAVRVRASKPQPIGTLGFGFWNEPFGFALGFGGRIRLPAPPRALWFFYGSPPNDFTFVRGGTGYGWRAMSIDTPPISSLALAPLAASAVLLAPFRFLRRRVVQAVIDRVLASEGTLGTRLDEWHTYSIDWMTHNAVFRVDGQLVLEAAGLRPPLGLVIWIDNQYAVVSPEKGFAFGTIPTTAEQWLEIQDLSLERPLSRS